jgi:hypothetical protein
MTLRWPSGSHCRGGLPRLYSYSKQELSEARLGVWGLLHERKEAGQFDRDLTSKLHLRVVPVVQGIKLCSKA